MIQLTLLKVLILIRQVHLESALFATIGIFQIKGLKSGSHLPKKNLFICFNDNPSKMMKNVFYFILKALFILKILNFCLDILGMQKKRLDQKDKVNFEIYDVAAWLTKNYNTHMLNISRIKDNQMMKFGQLIKHPKRNIFLKNHAEDEAGKLFLRKLYVR